MFEALLAVCEYLSRSEQVKENREGITQWLFEHRPEVSVRKWVRRVAEARSPISAINAMMKFEKKILAFFKRAGRVMPSYQGQLKVVTVFLENHISRLKSMKKSKLAENWKRSGFWWTVLYASRIRITESYSR